MGGPWVGIALAGAQMAQQSQAAGSSAEFNAAVAARNKEITERAISDSVLYGSGAASTSVEAGSRTIARANVMAASSGVDLGSPGVVGIMETTREYAALDAETIKNNALREALGLETQASSFEAQRRLAQVQGRYQQNAIALSGFSTIYGQYARGTSTVLDNPSYNPVPQGSPAGAGYGAGRGWDASKVDMAKGSN